MEKKKVYLTLKEVTGNNDRIDPFNLKKTVWGLAGDVGEVKVSKDGEYTIQCTAKQSEHLTRIKKLEDGTKVKCTPHSTLNTVRCVISHGSITRMSNEKLEKELAPQGIKKVKGFGPNLSLKLLTIKATTVPSTINIGLIKVKTKPYYPMVKLCKKCQRIGHFTEKCTNDEKCKNCSADLHTLNCKKKPLCGNCGGDHRPTDRTCPVYVQEKAIIKMAVDGGIPPSRARKEYRKTHEYRPPSNPDDRWTCLEEDEEVVIIESEDEAKEETPSTGDPPVTVEPEADGGSPKVTPEDTMLTPPDKPTKTKRRRGGSTPRGEVPSPNGEEVPGNLSSSDFEPTPSSKTKRKRSSRNKDNQLISTDTEGEGA